MVAKALLMSAVVILSQVQRAGQPEVWRNQSLGLNMTLPEGFRLVTLPNLRSTTPKDPSRPLMAAQMGAQHFGIIGLISTITPSPSPYASVDSFLHAVVLANQTQTMKIETEKTLRIAPSLTLKEMVYIVPVDGIPEYDAAIVTEWKGSLLSFKVNAPDKEARSAMLRSIETLRPSE